MMASLIGRTAAGQALIAAAQQRAAGAPVYLRYALEAPATAAADGADGLIRCAADAVAFAGEVLGAPLSVYVSAVRDAAGQIAHLAVATRHAEGCVALLGVGVAGTQRRPPTLLFLGDQGAIEGNPTASGVVLRDDSGPLAQVEPLRDDGTKALAEWTAAASETTSARLVAAIRRSLASGRAEALDQEVAG